MAGRGKAKGTVCGRCKGRLPHGARRCLRCGAQVFVAREASPNEAARNERERLLRKYDLSETQKSILSAAAEVDAKEITVCGAEKGAEGEVKSGKQRFYGNEAVAALAGLAGPGLVSPHGEDRFTLTPEGLKLVETLKAEPV